MCRLEFFLCGHTHLGNFSDIVHTVLGEGMIQIEHNGIGKKFHHKAVDNITVGGAEG